MVYVRDDGVFDASIEQIWKYIQDPESHQHQSILSQKVLEQKGNTMKIRAEIAGPQGKAEEIWQMRSLTARGLVEAATTADRSPCKTKPTGDFPASFCAL